MSTSQPFHLQKFKRMALCSQGRNKCTWGLVLWRQVGRPMAEQMRCVAGLQVEQWLMAGPEVLPNMSESAQSGMVSPHNDHKGVAEYLQRCCKKECYF